MVKAKLLYNPPTGPPRVVNVRIKGTKYIQDMGTGRMMGRRSVKNGETFTRQRVKQPFILVKRSKTARGHIRQARKEHNVGQFF